ncbi:MAG TPA: hypothetical protein VGK73_08015 [Polyangiaceae bacterium]
MRVKTDSSLVGRPSLAVATWGILGVALLLAQALVRLTPIALEPLRSGALTTVQAAIYTGWVLVSLYSEGYRGFQKAFVPRTVARAFHLAAQPLSLLSFLAPLYCMGLIHARPRRLLTSWSIVAAISIAVILVRRLAPPWRGIVDGGVVVGLAWGLVSLCHTFARAMRGAVPSYPLDLPS